MVDILVFLTLLGLGYFIGNHRERKHYEDIKRREKSTLHIPIMSWGAKQDLPYAHETEMFVGSVVIANDYFKTISAGLRNFVGGRVTVYETLIDRGRREAILRMKESAIEWGASQILNVRFETSNISGESGGGAGSVEIMAYGTGIR